MLDVIHTDRDLQGSQLSDRLLQLHDVDLLHARLRFLLRAEIQGATRREAFSGAESLTYLRASYFFLGFAWHWVKIHKLRVEKDSERFF